MIDFMVTYSVSENGIIHVFAKFEYSVLPHVLES